MQMQCQIVYVPVVYFLTAWYIYIITWFYIYIQVGLTFIKAATCTYSTYIHSTNIMLVVINKLIL